MRQCRLQDIRRGLETRRLPAADCNNARISVGSMVEIMDGPYRGKGGTVQHVYKMHIWLKCPEVTQVWQLIKSCASQRGGPLAYRAQFVRRMGPAPLPAVSVTLNPPSSRFL